jgi:Fe-S-cluster containining protein
MNMNDKPWYHKGLRFSCQGCGNCCCGAPGQVLVTIQEVKALAEELDVSIEQFRAMYTHPVGNRWTSLKERRNHDCVFLDKHKRCRVYNLRPRQCRTWPFWKRNLSSPENWEGEAENCPGMNRGKFYTCEEINNLAGFAPLRLINPNDAKISDALQNLADLM